MPEVLDSERALMCRRRRRRSRGVSRGARVFRRERVGLGGFYWVLGAFVGSGGLEGRGRDGDE